MRKIYISLLAIVIGFTACGKPTSALNYFENDKQSAKAIQFTKKRDLLNKDEIKVLVFVTYLNKVNEKFENDDNKEYFLLGVHDTNPDIKHSLNKDYTLLMNDNQPIKTLSLGKNPEIIKTIPLKNKYAQYYILTFNNSDETNDLETKFIHSKFGEASIKFDKR